MDYTKGRRCNWGYGNYELFPRIQVDGFREQAWKGYGPLAERLEELRGERKRFVVVAEFYPGCHADDILQCLMPCGFSQYISAEAAVKDSRVIADQIRDQLTDDRVFGRMNPTQKLEDFFNMNKLCELREMAEDCSSGNILIYGTGATLITCGDVLIYFDLPRREIQKRYMSGMGNFHGANGDAPYLEKFKRGYFAEWRAADRLKSELFDKIDFIADAVDETCPAICTGTAFREGIRQTAARPFRLAPYFAPEVWGGQWMKEAFDLDKDCEKYAWGFDGVPEENSILLDFGSACVELPAIDIVLMEPRALLGDDILNRFGAEFPIRFDLLDTIEGQNLSLQVHPTREYIEKEFGLPYTQDESYYILDTQGEEGCVYLGVKPGVSPDGLRSALTIAQTRGVFEAEKYVNCFPVKKHDHVLIPAGTVHCSGAGTMVLEISATPYIFTFKMWDWGRVGWDGKPRPIHIDRAMDNIQWERDTDWSKNNLLHRDALILQGCGFKEERTGLHELEFIETRRIVISDICLQDTHGTVQMLNLVDGAQAVVESPKGKFPPLTVHYAETFIIPARAGDFTIRPSGPSEGSEIVIIKANVRPIPAL